MVTHTALIVSHQSRMRCLLGSYILGIIPDPVQRAVDFKDNPEYEDDPEDELFPLGFTGGGAAKSGEVASFKNGAVLKLTVNRHGVAISLVVDGEIGEGEDKAGYTYFKSSRSISGGIKKKYNELVMEDDAIATSKYSDLISGDDMYVFYLIRHGQATHNVLKGRFAKMTSSKDTMLTEMGKAQAKNAGKSLYKYIQDEDNHSDLPTHLFVSDLKRTRQTMSNILLAFPNQMRNVETLTVLPCAHELVYVKSPSSSTGNESGSSCDRSQGISANENTSSCNTSIPGTCPTHTEGANGVDSRSLGWDKYYDFYGDATRSMRSATIRCLTCGKNQKKRCRDTDMIREAIKIINSSSGARDSEMSEMSGARDSEMSEMTGRNAMYERPSDASFDSFYTANSLGYDEGDRSSIDSVLSTEQPHNTLNAPLLSRGGRRRSAKTKRTARRNGKRGRRSSSRRPSKKHGRRTTTRRMRRRRRTAHKRSRK